MTPVAEVSRISSHSLPSPAVTTPPAPAAPPRSLGERIIGMELGWFTDFAWRDGAVVVRKTGATTPLNREVVGHFLTWLGYFLVVRGVSTLRRLAGVRGPAIWFSPSTPRPWYMIRSVAAYAGMRVAAGPEDADIAFHFDDSTWSPPAGGFAGRTLNGACLDIGKTRVNAAFAEVFGYALGVDPTTHAGDAVEKADANGTHDGRIVRCPTPALPGRCYQRLVRTGTHEVHDLRTTCVGGVPVQTWIKTRRAADRFASGANLRVVARDPRDVFSDEEMSRIAAFNARMGLDWGTLDILRDAEDGRIYVVDVNKTDVGPVLQLTMRDKLQSTRVIAAALKALIRDPR